ncbi:MAG: M48 family metalloprotease [bacterium]|nr:M48 family metalloprotease [bacterium]
MQKEKQHYNKLFQKSPEAAILFREATEAMDIGDEAFAEEKYRKVVELVKDYAPALRRLSYLVTSNIEAIKLARKALELSGHPYNQQALARALLRTESKEAREEAHTLALEVVSVMSLDWESQMLLAQTALATERIPVFQKAVLEMKKLAPDKITTHYFLGISATIKEDWEEAEKEFLRAKALGMDPKAVDKILKKYGISSGARNWRILRYSAYGVAGWMAFLVLLLCIGMLLSKITLLSIEKSLRPDKAPLPGAGIPSPGEMPSPRSGDSAEWTPSSGVRLLRRIYRWVLRLASISYYISQPVVILLVLATGGGMWYGFYSTGSVPGNLVGVTMILMLTIVTAMIKGLFVRPAKGDPGPRLEEKDAPRVFQALREVADKMNTRTVDTVFLMSGTEISVFERENSVKRWTGQTERCLLLGIAVLKGLTRFQFHSILAHEYGHFYSKDTAGGTMALQVRYRIHAAADAMAEFGQATWYNPAWHFINGFYNIFLRISEGASRLQEVMADRMAARAYGPNIFADGLTAYIKHSITFNMITKIELAMSKMEKGRFKNIYVLDVPETWPEILNVVPSKDSPPEKTPSPPEVVEKSFKAAMEVRTSDYDSHPAPRQRIQWVKSIKGIKDQYDHSNSAAELMKVSQKMQEEMSRQMRDHIIQSSIEQAMREAVYEEDWL